MMAGMSVIQKQKRHEAMYLPSSFLISAHFCTVAATEEKVEVSHTRKRTARAESSVTFCTVSRMNSKWHEPPDCMMHSDTVPTALRGGTGVSNSKAEGKSGGKSGTLRTLQRGHSHFGRLVELCFLFRELGLGWWRRGARGRRRSGLLLHLGPELVISEADVGTVVTDTRRQQRPYQPQRTRNGLIGNQSAKRPNRAVARV